METMNPSTYRFDQPESTYTYASATTPKWDPVTHVLFLGEVIVKEYQRPARSQQTILAAFEQEGWPTRIDDPLILEEGALKTKSKWRLRNTVNDLNRAQYGCLRIRFHLDGTGRGIRWKIQIE